MNCNFVHVNCEQANDPTVVVVTIANGPVNVLSVLVARELCEVFARLKSDDKVRAAIVTGQGRRAFVAGADIKEFNTVEASNAREYLEVFQDALLAVENSPFPVIASINGLALGGGCELALACDIRIAARSARIGLPEVGIGVIPAAGGTQRLPRTVPATWARELLFTGDMITAEQAQAIGLVSRVFDDEQLAGMAMTLARKIALKAPVAVKNLKSALQSGRELLFNEALKMETQLGAECFATEDIREGIAAFMQKRSPVFTGR